MMQAIVSVPILVYALAAGWLAFWVLNLHRDLRPATPMVNLLCLIGCIQLAMAILTMGLTARGAIDTAACLLGIGGMFANMLLFVIAAPLTGVLALAAPGRLKAVGGVKLPLAIVLTSWLAAVIHTRSALLCTV